MTVDEIQQQALKDIVAIAKRWEAHPESTTIQDVEAVLNILALARDALNADPEGGMRHDYGQYCECSQCVAEADAP